MGTAKRERQKANRQAKLESLQREQAKKKTTRRVLLIGLLLVVFVVGAWLLSQLVSGGDDETVEAATTTVADGTTTLADGATTTVDAGATTTLADGATTTVTDSTTTLLDEGFVYGATPCPATDGSAPQQREFSDSFQQCIDPSKTYTALVETNKGDFTITFDAVAAPGTVNNFVSLARHQFYDGLTFHRVVKDFVVQGGDPAGDGTGGPGYSFADELPEAGAYQLGSVAMANSGPDTNGSQFFIVTGENGTQLPPNYSLFGQVTEGFETTVKALEAAGGEGDGPPTEELVIDQVTITER